MMTTPTPTPGAAAELPIFERCPCGTLGRWVSPDNLAPNAFLDSLDALREEVARLTKERDSARLQVRDWIAANTPGGWIDNMREELAALKAQPTDVDALMALADEWTTLERRYERGNASSEACDAAREALRAKLAARKEV